MRKLYRIEKNSKIAGVCEGLGRYFDMDPVIFRVLMVVLVLGGGIGLWAYLIMWLIVPVKGARQTNWSAKRLQLVESGKRVGGVCTGLSAYFDRDPTLFRVIFLILACMGGVGVVLYLAIWLICPRDENGSSDRETITIDADVD